MAKLARRAAAAFGVVALLGVIGYAWNARNLPSLAALPPPSLRRRSRIGAWITKTILARDRTVRAGFDFTLAAMWRSNTHRLTLVSAAAAGFALAVLALSNANAQQAAGPSSRLLAMQPLLYGALLVGFRHIIRVPAELRANWGFQLAWRGRENAFVSGVRRAAVLALVLPSLAILFPLFVFVLGPAQALAHAALGLAGAIVLLEALMAELRQGAFHLHLFAEREHEGAGARLRHRFHSRRSVVRANAEHRATHRQPGAPADHARRVVRGLSIDVRSTACAWPNIDFDEAPATFQGLGLHRN